ncbi:YcaO-like family protein [Rhizobium sp. CNPSo 4039]|uniref:YcaO-like family protein n=1 Tax=Rhizobium sp. CNPSo 4039 TaxID=3021409 RepID=UPI00254AD882|nr:YcaO-like family protein [Rhizobium sp. CNPSo 4039]MDK4717631.1 YcaO-like family protein [Rhizobium sp. CNPSo 4039]
MINDSLLSRAVDRLAAEWRRSDHSYSNYYDRRVAPSQTLASIKPHLAGLGITRIGLVTGLDNLEIPVAIATRPNSYTLSVFQGKGLDNDSAMVSAAMEALETRLAEIRPNAFLTATVSEMVQQGAPCIDLASTARCNPHDIGDDPLCWVEGLDLVTNSRVYVPWPLVGMDHRFACPGFEQSSDGLASGNSAAEAILHGVCELVERDAWTLAQLASISELSERIVDPLSMEDGVLNIILARIWAAGMRLVLVDVTTDIAIPAFIAMLVPTEKRPKLRRSDICGGCGCHPDPARAALKAILEAAQSRLTAIAGSRDDFSSHIYQEARAEHALLDFVALAEQRGKPHGHPVQQQSSIDEISRGLVGNISAIGVRQIIAVPLQDEGLPVSVVRMIVPGLEVDIHGQSVQLGPRAAAALRRTRH